ncbi:PD-(D/E)XK motif protein [Amycolatopsis pigmentata]|uniref:PD-(D/E)XK motif protein n=1 Tax=Amycolatopsis pigmentata TaxID=450801 RepID=A0ABW5FQM1_9PSEU
MTDLPPDRHLDSRGLKACLATSAPVEIPIEGTPPIRLFIDPYQPAVGIRCHDDGSSPETELDHLRVRTIHHDGTPKIEIAITEQALFIDGYPVLCAIADRVQLGGSRLASALSETVRFLGQLLHRTDGMSQDAEIGLFGELLFLLGLLGTVGTETGVQAWLGPETEEHDFSLRGLDLEVKTTSAERRRHWISSVSQLEAKPNRDLWFVSQQVTQTGTGGRTLAELVEVVRTRVGASTVRTLFEERLDASGWRGTFATRLRRQWLRRSEAATYRVDTDFPRLSEPALRLPTTATGRIVQVRYEIDLTGVPSAPNPPSFIRTAVRMER